LASFKKSSNYSVEGGIIYFVTGAVSSAFFLFGSSYIYGATGTINFTDLADLFSLAFNKADLYNGSFDYSFIELGLTLILFSLFIKLALAPFHLWSLDVYEGLLQVLHFFSLLLQS
jgi:NADH-quinone oxidoreductase subunit N